MNFLSATVLTVVVLVIIFGLCWIAWRTDNFIDWFKGSRKTYYLGSRDISSLRSTNATPEKLARIAEPRILTESLIEISRGPFRRPSAIYGPVTRCWRIQEDWHEFGIDSIGAVRVLLADTRELLLENALRLINTYSSLQAMLDRIAELENELARGVSEDKVKLITSLQALRIKLIETKQRFRSLACQEIRSYIELVLREMGERELPESLATRKLFYRWLLEKFQMQGVKAGE